MFSLAMLMEIDTAPTNMFDLSEILCQQKQFTAFDVIFVSMLQFRC